MKKTCIKALSLTLALVFLVACVCVFVACDEEAPPPSCTFDKTTRFGIDFEDILLAGSSLGAILAPFTNSDGDAWLIDGENSYVEFYTDGTMHAQIQTAPSIFEKLGELGSLLGDDADGDLNTMLASARLERLIEIYVEPMFPGWTDKLKQEDLKGAMELIEGSLGFGISGIDFENEGIKRVVASLASNMRESGRFKVDDDVDLTSILGALKDENGQGVRLSIEFDNTYRLVERVAQDGKPHQTIFIGDVAFNTATQPWAVMSMSNNADSEDEKLQALGGRRLVMHVNLANATIPCNEIV